MLGFAVAQVLLAGDRDAIDVGQLGDVDGRRNSGIGQRAAEQTGRRVERLADQLAQARQLDVDTLLGGHGLGVGVPMLLGEVARGRPHHLNSVARHATVPLSGGHGRSRTIHFST